MEAPVIGFGSKVKDTGGNTGVVTWVGKHFPEGHKVKVKWDLGGNGLILIDQLEVTV